MESQFEVFLAFWLTTWVMTQYRVFYPSMMILGEMDNTAMTYRWWPFVWVIFAIGSFITVPILIFTCFSDRQRDIFVRGYVTNLLKIEL